MWEFEGRGRLGFERYYTGRQALDEKHRESADPIRLHLDPPGLIDGAGKYAFPPQPSSKEDRSAARDARRPGMSAQAVAASSASCSLKASRMRSRTRSCDVASTIGRSSAKLRRSPFTEY
jgi:hypothetical protein